MTDWWIRIISYRLILLLAVIVCLIRFKQLDKASKYFAIALGLNFFVEVLAVWAALKFQQNNIIYNIHSPINLLLTCLYFNTLIDSFRRKNIGIILGVLGLVVALINSAYYQSIWILNTYFIATQAILVVFMCLYYYYDFLKRDTFSKDLPLHFWITSILLTYWSFTLFHWILGYSSYLSNKGFSILTYYVIFIINLSSYIGFTILFYKYNKFKPSGGD